MARALESADVATEIAKTSKPRQSRIAYRRLQRATMKAIGDLSKKSVSKAVKSVNVLPTTMTNLHGLIPAKRPQPKFLMETGWIPWYIIDPTGDQIVKQREFLRKEREEELMTKMTKEERLAWQQAPKTYRLKHQLSKFVDSLTLFPLWDMVTSIALIFTAVFTPFEVGFLANSAPDEPIFIINRVVDGIFVLDMMINFFLMQKMDTRKRTDRQWETRLHKLALRYLIGWFALDIISIVPSIFDIISATDGSEGGVPKSVRGTMRTSKLFWI